MEKFAYYYETWTLYIFLGLAFNALVFQIIKDWRRPLIAVLGAGCIAFTFTPLTTSEGSTSIAPALVVAIFELEASLTGESEEVGIERGLFRILGVWFMLSVIMLGVWYFLEHRKKQTGNSS